MVGGIVWNYQRLGNVRLRTISTESSVIAEEGGLWQKQDGKQLNYGLGIYKEVFDMKENEVNIEDIKKVFLIELRLFKNIKEYQRKK